MKGNVANYDIWLKARLELLEKEKAYSRLRDELTRERQALPWVKVEKDYVFNSEQGEVHLGELFGDKSQLIVQHFMFEPDWEAGCKSCSYMADHIDPATVHLAQRDTAFVAISIAPISKLSDYKRRMNWQFNWVSSQHSSFNRDFQVSFSDEERTTQQVTYNYQERTSFPCNEAPGISTFVRDENGDIFHTYSVYGRGLEKVMTAYDLLDMAPKGRDEGGKNMFWLRRKDEYGE
ncbi:DUF899 domain-containing protein [Photobacterium satsumensis]|uniref:DUF899 domain-containing protein n=1 Tax=Photobacterium satsumensis TaxID=2910239 RepID=UPI003D1204EA